MLFDIKRSVLNNTRAAGAAHPPVAAERRESQRPRSALKDRARTTSGGRQNSSAHCSKIVCNKMAPWKIYSCLPVISKSIAGIIFFLLEHCLLSKGCRRPTVKSRCLSCFGLWDVLFLLWMFSWSAGSSPEGALTEPRGACRTHTPQLEEPSSPKVSSCDSWQQQPSSVDDSGSSRISLNLLRFLLISALMSSVPNNTWG